MTTLSIRFSIDHGPQGYWAHNFDHNNNIMNLIFSLSEENEREEGWMIFRFLKYNLKKNKGDRQGRRAYVTKFVMRRDLRC